MHLTSTLLWATAAAALCPMSELARRGLAPEDMKKAYLAGRGLGEPGKRQPQENGEPILDPVSGVLSPIGLGGLVPKDAQENGNPILDPLSGVLSPLGLGGLVPRSARSDEHNAIIDEHFRARLEERDEDVNINAPILTPKAQKRHLEERGLIGGLLAPLSGLLQALDLPTPQESGLKAIPGDDPKHQYQPPGPTDVRGNCPTLNTLANHGYLSRTGVTSFAEAANAIQTAYSMSFDIAVFLSALGLLAGGDIPTGKYTIGGRDSRVPETLGQPLYGIDRHGLFEIDASVNRGDRYFGDSHSFNITKWNQLVDYANQYGDGLFNLDVMSRQAADSVDWSRANNPEFTMGANFAVIYATRALLTRPLPNGTAPNTPDFKNIAPFYLNETFPEGWFRIPHSYSLVDLLADIGAGFLYKPQPLGANYNGRFIPLEIQVPTAPQDVGCLGAALLASGAPNEAQVVVQAVNALKEQIFTKVLGAAACNIANYNKAAETAYSSPGENTEGGSGSGITRKGEWDSQTHRGTGQSAGQRRKRSFNA